jgi:hypothetical protein
MSILFCLRCSTCKDIYALSQIVDWAGVIDRSMSAALTRLVL